MTRKIILFAVLSVAGCQAPTAPRLVVSVYVAPAELAAVADSTVTITAGDFVAVQRIGAVAEYPDLASGDTIAVTWQICRRVECGPDRYTLSYDTTALFIVSLDTEIENVYLYFDLCE